MMRPLAKPHIDQAFNVALRLGSMGVKLGLTLYMGHAFALADIGLYGLALGAVTILTVFFGQNFAYIVNRDIVGVDTLDACHKMRDQFLFYGANYAVFFVAILLILFFQPAFIDAKTAVYVFILTVLEGFGTVTYFNLNSRDQQIRANALFFIRSALWVFPVVGLCVFFPALRNADTVLVGWIIGATVSLIVTAWLWCDLPWRRAMRIPVDWVWIKKGIVTVLLVWVGMLGVTGGSFLDRFVVEHYLSLTDVGVLTFYFSFTGALLTLTQSGVAAFATPRLVQHHRDRAHEDFADISRHASREIAVGAGVAALALAFAVPALCALLGRPAFVADTGVFLMMLFASWLRANAEMLNTILFARHQDRAIWLGNLFFLIPAFGGNIILVPIFGLNGVGYSAVIAALFLLGWRRWQTSYDEKVIS